MKRRVLAGCLVLALFLCGCQKTPDKEAVVSKAGGLDKEVIADELSDGEGRTVNLPGTWTATEEKNEGQVKISVNIPLDSPKITNTPVIEMENEEFTDKELKNLVEYFAEGEKVYEPREKTKSELEAIKKRIENKKGVYSDPRSISYNQERSSNLTEMIQNAQDEKPTLKEADIKFDVEKSRLWRQSRQFFGVKEEVSQEKDRFRAIIGEKGQASVRSFCYNKNAGTTSNFVYQKGAVYLDSSVKDLEENNESSLELEGDTGFYTTTYKPQLDEMREAMNREGHDEEKGRQEAEQLLESLDIKGLSFYSSENGVWVDKADISDSFDLFDDLWDFDWSRSKPGHLYKFTTDVNGLSADYKPGQDYDTPEDSYAPPFGVETVEVFVTEDGVQSFEWSNMARKVKNVAGNTNLLAFEKIQEKLFDHLFYVIASETAGQNGEGTGKYQYDILNARLGYTYAAAYESPEHAWLVPAWFFTVRKRIEAGGAAWNRATEYVMMNALDGGYISPNYAVIGNQNR